MEIFVEGLELYGYHGVLTEEKTLGQPFIYDLRLTVTECRGAESDCVADTVDYTEVIDAVSAVASETSFDLLERLAQAVGETVLARFPVDAVCVRVRKPRPPVPCTVAAVGVAVELTRVPGADPGGAEAALGRAGTPATSGGPAA